MSETDTPYTGRKKAEAKRTVLVVIACVLVAVLSDYAGWMPFVPAIVFALCLVRLIRYWIRPGQDLSFQQWSGAAIGVMLLIALIYWIIPAAVAQWMYPPLAYAICLFIFSMVMSRTPFFNTSLADKSLRAAIGLSLIMALMGAAIGYIRLLRPAPSLFNATRFLTAQIAAQDAYIKQDYDSAEAQNKIALEEAERESPENGFVLQALHELGATYQAANRYEDAEAIFQRQVAVAERVYGPESQDMLWSLTDLSMFYIAQGKIHEASESNRRAVKISENGVDENHTATADMARAIRAVLESKQAQR